MLKSVCVLFNPKKKIFVQQIVNFATRVDRFIFKQIGTKDTAAGCFL